MTGQADDLVILVPVLGRPHRVAPTLDAFHRTAPGCRVLFIADPGDREELEAIRGEGAQCIAPGGGYASKINAGIRATGEPLLFFGADDLEPQDGWLKASLAVMKDGTEVVGVNDLLRRPRVRRGHATHFLVTRSYAERPTIDGHTGCLSESYVHCCVDDELIATAKKRGVYAYAADARVAHLHWMNRRAEIDPTYQRGIDSINADRALFREREHLWA